jgi:protein-S-isoprenylcysteine O-methyltransferase Ste14
MNCITPGSPTVIRITVLFYAVQAAAVVGWWVLLWTIPEARGWFVPESMTGLPLLSFWGADLVVAAGGSVVTAWGVATRQRMAGAAAWLVAGGLGYAALYCLELWRATGEGAIGAVMMTVAAGLSLSFATIVGMNGPPAAFRAAANVSTAWIAVKTLLQILVFWSVFLLILPAGILHLQRQAGLATLESPVLQWTGWMLFALASALGLASAWVMVRVGRGTPLPTDSAPRLVVTGPYRFIRNPMATAGIVQGAAVGVAWGSWPIVIYAVLGGLVWHCLVRPVEEQDMLARFGEPYRRYRAAVRCWWPVRRSSLDA